MAPNSNIPLVQPGVMAPPLTQQPLQLWKRLRALQRHSPDDILQQFAVTRPPVDVVGIANAMGVQVYQIPTDEWYGLANPAQSAIWLRQQDEPARQRFTAAHELGHLMLHPLIYQYPDLTFTGNQWEHEANQFAASLLMPYWMLEPFMRGYKANHIPYLANLFMVSENAMNVRIFEMIGYPVQR